MVRFFLLILGATTKEDKSTEPNPYPGTKISDYSEASRSGSHVTQHFHHGDVDSSITAELSQINKQMQEWQEKFQQQMNEFNTNLHNDILQNIQKSFQNSIPTYKSQFNWLKSRSFYVLILIKLLLTAGSMDFKQN